MPSVSLILTKYRRVVDRFAEHETISLAISSGTLAMDVYMAGGKLRYVNLE
jgi:hypothetical protein